MKTQLNLSDEECIFLNEIELAYELSHLKLNAAVLKKIMDYKNSGFKIIIISDMYLEKFQLEEILTHFQISALFDEVYVSSSENFNKYDGSAFRTLENMGIIDPKSLRHYGDNLISDVQVPSSLGIESVLIPRRFRQIYEAYGRKVNEYEMRKAWMK
jgi:predicted HAD superfamily hydrolase